MKTLEERLEYLFEEAKRISAHTGQPQYVAECKDRSGNMRGQDHDWVSNPEYVDTYFIITPDGKIERVDY